MGVLFLLSMLLYSSTVCYLKFNNLRIVTSIDVLAETETNPDYFEGYNLFILEINEKDEFVYNKSIIISDLEGNFYFQKVIGTDMLGLHVSTEFVNSTTILYSDAEGAKLWNIETDVIEDLNFRSHHDIEKNYANDTYFLLSNYYMEIEGEDYLYDTVREVTIPKQLIWSFRTENIVSADQWCVFGEMTGGYRDLTHTNTVIYDEVGDDLYFLLRNVNSFYKIDHKTKEVLWSLGEYGNFSLFDLNGKSRDILFFHPHALEMINENTFILFDNDQHNLTDALNQSSRLMEITIDEDKMEAYVTWEWIAPVDYFSKIWGDCDLLPNGNFFGTFGTHSHPNSNYGARLVEVNRNGDIVWEMSFPRTVKESHGVYQTERFRFAPIVSQPQIIKDEIQDYIEWDVWYNFRAKTEFTGKYYITIDGQLVESEQITFPRFWQPTKIRYSLENIDEDAQEITLVVEDEAGHLSNDTDKYNSIGTLSLQQSKIGLIIGLSVGGTTFLALITYVVLRISKKKLISKNE